MLSHQPGQPHLYHIHPAAEVVPGGSRPERANATRAIAAATANAIAMPMLRWTPALAVTAAPPTPMPVAVPSVSVKFSDAEACPSCPGGARCSIISESGA